MTGFLIKAALLACMAGGIQTDTTEANIDFLTGRFDPATHPSFVIIPAKYTDKPDIYLHRETYAAFERMAEAAAKEGIRMRIISATRNFEAQKTIWENKWFGRRLVEGKKLTESHPDPASRALKILEYSSMPGTSRHHWGTDFDINALEDSYFLQGEGKKLHEWLSMHAAEFGFCRPYSARSSGRLIGYEEEKWHLSYIPLSSNFTKAYPEKVGYTHIRGFAGAEIAEKIGVIEKWVLGISTDCLP